MPPPEDSSSEPDIVPRPADSAGEPAAAAVLPLEAPSGEPEAAAPARTPTRLQRFRAWRFAPIVEIILTLGLALGLAESVQAAIVKPFVIPSESMEPTLIPSQRVLVNRLAYDFGSPHRGDIVVFHPPQSLSCGKLASPDEPCPRSDRKPSSTYFVKRVMALPGDRLSIRNGHPVIDGHEISHEPYITACGNVTACNMPRAITIPEGEYYMLGDNRGDSDDSRFWGPVPKAWIVGEVFATYWPPDRIGIF
jgi:signal peptidase I